MYVLLRLAKVTITSKTPASQVAYRAKYSDGRLAAAGPGQSADPRPCAGVTGTTILVREKEGAPRADYVTVSLYFPLCVYLSFRFLAPFPSERKESVRTYRLSTFLLIISCFVF